MINDIEIERLFAQLEMPEEGRKLVRFTRANDPVVCNSRLGYSIIWQFSRKMGGKHLELPGRTVASPTAMMYENDQDCIEFWPRPFEIDLIINNSAGNKSSRQKYVPGFLAIQSNCIYVHDWKEESQLIKKSLMSSQIFKDGDGRWHNLSVEKYFSKTGLTYELHSSLEHPRNYIRNVRFLEDYQAPNCSQIPEEIESKLVKLVGERGCIPFLELIDQHQYSADNIFKAVLKKSVAVDLYNNRLEVAEDLIIFRDSAFAKAHYLINTDRTPTLPMPGMGRISAGAKIEFSGKTFEVMLVGGGSVLLRDDSGEKITIELKDVETLYSNSNIEILNASNKNVPPVKVLSELSYEQIDSAIKKIDIIADGSSDRVSNRTIGRWKSNIDSAMPMLDKLIALADNNKDKGNRTRRLPEIVETLAEESIRKFYNTSDRLTATAVFHKYQLVCEGHSVVPMSFPTFTKRVKLQASVKDREGKRKAYQEAPIPLFLDYGSPVHGVRPHEVCYIDHTILNLATVGPNGAELGKPTFTHAVDGNTTQSRAFYVGYDPPSARVVLMTLRDYVRRNNRLPKILVVDGGKEFRSKELAWFCRLFGIDIRYRPAGKCRGGSPVERAMGSTETEVIAQMAGNTRIMKNVRLVTKSVNPFPNAIWTLFALHGALDEYLYNIRETRVHPTLGLKPREFEAMRMRETGQREHVLVRFDQNIMLLTCPHTKRKLHKIDLQRGVWADNAYYWNDEFKVAIINEEAEVRIEPWCANVVYVYFRDHWIAAIIATLGLMKVGRLTK